MSPAGMVVGPWLGVGSGQQGGRKSDWDCKVSRTTQACNAAVDKNQMIMLSSSLQARYMQGKSCASKATCSEPPCKL